MSLPYMAGASLTDPVRLDEVVSIAGNQIHVDGDLYPGLDRPAVLELRGLVDARNRQPIVDGNDDGLFAPCAVPRCTNLASTPTSVSFTVSGFTTCATEVVACIGEASPPGLAQEMLVTGFDPATGEVTLTYTPACNATDHAVYTGLLQDVGNYEYTDVSCVADSGGVSNFTPGGGDRFWVVVGQGDGREGSYGRTGRATFVFISPSRPFLDNPESCRL